MPSAITWLDYSSRDQDDVRALIRALDEPGTLDDLGIGTIRDAISNALFPGTSSIQTRARYFLFIPWIFREAETRYPARLLEKAGDMERLLIGAFDQADDRDGLIGRSAGAQVRTLPSSIYWAGLRSYGIFTEHGLTIQQYGRRFASARAHAVTEDEIADRKHAFWNRDIPSPPDGFFDFASADFSLTDHEATWLLERIGAAISIHGDPSLLSLLLADRTSSPEPYAADRVWDLNLPGGVPKVILQLVDHARNFSSAVQGAQLLYNLVLAERRQAQYGDDLEASADDRRAELALWRDRALAADLADWASDIDRFKDCLIAVTGAAPKALEVFLRPWCKLLAGNMAIWDDAPARRLIEHRERSIKGPQSRFVNAKRLRDWDGYIQIEPLDFRWGQVRSMINEIGGAIAPAEGSVALA